MMRRRLATPILSEKSSPRGSDDGSEYKRMEMESESRADPRCPGIGSYPRPPNVGFCPIEGDRTNPNPKASERGETRSAPHDEI